jgi:hypothetical protein
MTVQIAAAHVMVEGSRASTVYNDANQLGTINNGDLLLIWHFMFSAGGIAGGGGDSSWVGQTITGLTPASPGYTVASAPGQTAVSMAGMTVSGTTNNLLVEGVDFSGVFAIRASTNGIAVKYDTFENLSNNAAVESDPVNPSGNNQNLDIEFNQIDHTKYCLWHHSGDITNGIYSHNVCGPGLGYGASDNNTHYIQAECTSGMTINNNAFIGPMDASGIAVGGGAHNNVSHGCGSNLKFDNNIVWHAQSRAQTVLWGDDATVQTAEMNNNLMVEYTPDSPSCNSFSVDCPTWSLEGDPQQAGTYSNLTQNNNTIIANSDGGIRDEGTGTGRPSNWVGLTISNNIIVNGGSDYFISTNTCTSCSGNVSDDGARPGTGGVTSWTPSWQSTSWTPNDGPPWAPPADTFYKPNLTGGVTSGEGWQGVFCTASVQTSCIGP